MKIFTLYEKVKFSSELIILFGLKSKSNIPFEQLRYKGLIKWCQHNIMYVNKVEKCDIIVFPYKFPHPNTCNYIDDQNFNYLNLLSKEHKKPLWCFYNDDDDTKFNIESNVTLFRTSFYKTLKQNNEYGLPSFSNDHFNFNFTMNISIGFCGDSSHGRKKYLDMLNDSDIQTNFIFRKGHFAPEISDKTIAIKQYFKNIENNLFVFCYRGGGNFSYRFYETLMMGRIPILINTDCLIPFEKIIKTEQVGIFIDEQQILNNKINLIKEIKNYIEKYKNKFINIQENNRKIWEKYLSPIGFLNNIIHGNY